MAGLVPAIYVFLSSGHEDVDARHKAGHDEIVGRSIVEEPLNPQDDRIRDRPSGQPISS
jgi:hypothetical protein